MSTENKPADELQQQLLELVYGLLPDDEAAALQERMASDPEVAVAHAEAQRFADLLAASARLAAPHVELAPPDAEREKTGQASMNGVVVGSGVGGGSEALTPGPSPKKGEVSAEAAPRKKPSSDEERRAKRRKRRRAARSLPGDARPSPRSSSDVEQRIRRAMRRTAAIAAAVLAAVTLGGYVISSWRLVGLDAKHVHLVVAGPHRLEPGIDNLFTINTTSATGKPLTAAVSYKLHTADGKTLVPETEQSTDSDGRLTVKIRADLGDAKWGHEAALEITPVGQSGLTPLATSLTIDPTPLATQLALDKPIYQPGDIVRYRSLTLTRFSLNSPSEVAVQVDYEIHDPSGAVVPASAIGVATQHGVGSGEFQIPANLPGGEYTLIARSMANRFAEAKRTFFVRQYRLPRLKKDLEFTRDSYAPGDNVAADLSVQRTEGSPAAGARLHCIATVDGQIVSQTDEQASAAGSARIEFKLPAEIKRGDAQLAIIVDDGGNKETIAKTIRINLDRVEVSLYPEGGELIAGLESRVYFMARDPLGKPAHLDGQLVDRDGREVARVQTTYKGMGSFKFTPTSSGLYTLKLKGPAHVEQEPKSFAPAPARHIVLSTGRGVFEPKQPLTLDLVSNEKIMPLVVAAYCRGALVGQQAITAHEGTNHVEIPLAPEFGGVVRVTVFDQLVPISTEPRAIAERLVYRRPERLLKVHVTEHSRRYSPGDPVELSLAVTNERGEPTAAALGVSVTPDTLFKMIDDELPSMPTQFYLTSEIEKPEDLEKADFFLSDDAQAPAALDLLLGTQGWRRFVDAKPTDFVQSDGRKQNPARVATAGEIGGPPLVLDNGQQVAAAYQADLDRHQAERASDLQSLGRCLLLGGSPIALLFLFIAAWGSVGGLRFWLPTIGTATACFAIAWIWSGNSPIASTIADESTIAKIQSPAARRLPFDHAESAAAPAAPTATGDWRDAVSFQPPMHIVQRPTSNRFAFSQPTQQLWGPTGGVQSNYFYYDPADFRLPVVRGIVFTAGSAATFTADEDRESDSQVVTIFANLDSPDNPGAGVRLAGIGGIANQFGAAPLAVIAGTLSIGGASANIYTGGTMVSGGTLRLGNNSGVLLSTEALGTGQLGAADFSDANVGGTTFGASNLAKSGAGTLTLSSANAYTGTTTINGGTLRFNTTAMSATATGASTLDVAVVNGSSGTLNVDNAAVGNGLGAGSNSIQFAGGVVMNSSAARTENGTLSGSIGGNLDVQWRTQTEPQTIGGMTLSNSTGSSQLGTANVNGSNGLPFPDELPITAYDRRYNRISVVPIFSSIGDVEPFNFATGAQSVDPNAGRVVRTGQGGGIFSGESTVVGADATGKLPTGGWVYNPAPPIEYETKSNAAGPVASPQIYPTIQIREYAHHHESASSGTRTDFTETLYWNPLLITDADGKATIKFDLADAVAKYRVLVDAHAHTAAIGEGRIGSGTGDVVSQLPVDLEPKLPLEVNAGDRIDLPVAVVNDTDGELPVALAIDLPSSLESHAIISPTVPKLLEVDGANSQQLQVAAGSRKRTYFSLNVVGDSGTAAVEVRGQAGKLTDAKRQTLAVVPAGFPVAASYGGKLSGEIALTVRIPREKEMVPGTLKVSLTAFPSTLSDLQHGIESILQEPYGCFEQASASNYPNVLTLEYLQTHKVANPLLTRRAKELIKSGYAKLTAYECSEKGYEWFGSNPGHEALTAYGVLEFREMARVYEVDPTMIKRTADWLMNRRDGQGGFQRNTRSCDNFGAAPVDLTNAYIVWALTESGQTGLEAEIKHTVELGRTSDDPYVIALAAASAINGNQADAGRELLEKLAKRQAADGHLEGRDGSITRSGGVSLNVETTALAALAWLKLPEFSQQAQKAIDWIVQNRQGSGGFGSTQATILALKALVEQANAHGTTLSGGELVVKRDGQTIGRQSFSAGRDSIIRIDLDASKLTPGENRLTITISGDNRFPYALDVSYRSYTSSSDPACPIRLSTKLAAEKVKAGETVALEAVLSNVTDKGQPMTIAILGLPAGLQPRANQLKELKKAGTIDYYETRAREVIFYWRSLAPRQKIPLRLDLVAEFPGQYTAPASRAYLYYTAEQKQWVEPLRVTVTRE